MVGVASRIGDGTITDETAFRTTYDTLLASNDFIAATSTGTSQEANVKARVSSAIEAFASAK